MNLPQGLTLDALANKWAAILNPVIANPSIQSLILKNIVLTPGSNTINHLLGRELVGWRIIRVNRAVTFFDSQDSNPHPDLTLILTPSGPVTASIEVF